MDIFYSHYPTLKPRKNGKTILNAKKKKKKSIFFFSPSFSLFLEGISWSTIPKFLLNYLVIKIMLLIGTKNKCRVLQLIVDLITLWSHSKVATCVAGVPPPSLSFPGGKQSSIPAIHRDQQKMIHHHLSL